MNEMKKQALEKLMMVVDEILGSDVKGRMSGEEKPEVEIEVEDEEKEGKEVASGGSSVLGLPENSEDEGAVEERKPAGVGIEVDEVKIAAMPKPGLMKKMRGMKA
jgi:hypothetical protein